MVYTTGKATIGTPQTLSWGLYRERVRRAAAKKKKEEEPPKTIKAPEITPLSPEKEGFREKFAKFKTTGEPTKSIGGVKLTAEEYETAKGRLGFAGGGGPVTPAVAMALEKMRTKTPEEIQEMILERERKEREGIAVEELPPEEQLPVIAPAITEEPNILQEVQDVYNYIDTLGGLLPEEGMKDVKMGTVPIFGPGVGMIGGVKSGKAVLNTSKVATGIRSTKAWTGMLKALKTHWKKLAKWGGIGYVLWSERSIGNIDSALSQVRESITLPVSLAAMNPNRIQDSFDMITDLENDVRGYESDVKLKENFTPTFKLTGRARPIYQRIKKLDVAIDLARNQIAKTEAMGTKLTDEETALMMGELNQILDGMEEPAKFLGII